MKTGGVEEAVIGRGAAIVFVLALIVLAFAASVVLVMEHRGQLGTSIVLAAIAASGLQWLAGRVRVMGETNDTSETNRVRSTGGIDPCDEQQFSGAGQPTPAFERAAYRANASHVTGAGSCQPGRAAGSAKRAAAGDRSKIHQLTK